MIGIFLGGIPLGYGSILGGLLDRGLKPELFGDLGAIDVVV